MDLRYFATRVWKSRKNVLSLLSLRPSNTLIYGISRDGSKNFNIRTCEHMILGQLTMGARQTKNAPRMTTMTTMTAMTVAAPSNHPWVIPTPSSQSAV